MRSSAGAAAVLWGRRETAVPRPASCVAFIIALGDRDRISGALHERTWGLVFPFIGLLAIYFIFLTLRLRPQALPFTMTAPPFSRLR